jgi:hypothetical protein
VGGQITECLSTRSALVGEDDDSRLALEQFRERVEMCPNAGIIRQAIPLDGAVDVDPNADGRPRCIEIRQRL